MILDVCLLVFNPAMLKLCTVCSLHYRLQQEVKDRSSGTRETAGHWPGLCVLPRPVISFARWTSLDVAKQHLTFRSSLNQADDQEQVQTAHIMQTFYKVVSTQAWLYVYFQNCFMGYNESGESFSGQDNINWKEHTALRYCVPGVSKWALQGSVGKKLLKFTEFYGFILIYMDWSNIID